MPAIACKDENGNPTGKWKWGKHGQCLFDTKKDAEKAGIAIIIDKIKNKLSKLI